MYFLDYSMALHRALSFIDAMSISAGLLIVLFLIYAFARIAKKK